MATARNTDGCSVSPSTLAGGEDVGATRFHEIAIMNGSPLLYFDGET